MVDQYKITAQKNHPKYDDANKLLENILKKKDPESYRSVVRNLFDDNYDSVMLVLNSFYNSDYEPGTLREENPSVPVVLDKYRERMYKNPKFIVMHNSFRNRQIPDDNILEYFFGDNTPFIERQTRELSYEFNLERKCKLPMVMHYSRNAGVMNELVNDPEWKHHPEVLKILLGDLNPKDANAFSFQHDPVENYFSLMHQIMTLEEFLDIYVKKELHEKVMRITNKRDMLIKYAKSEIRRQDKALTKGNIVAELEKIEHDNTFSLGVYARSILSRILSVDTDMSFEDIQWICRKDYLVELVNGFDYLVNGFHNYHYSKPNPDYLVIVGKYDDHDDNVHGNEDLEMQGRIKSIVKPAITGEQVYLLHTDFKLLNDLTEEAFNKSWKLAKYYLTDKILHRGSNMDHMQSLINYIKDLESVLYVDKPVAIFNTAPSNTVHAG